MAACSRFGGRCRWRWAQKRLTSTCIGWVLGNWPEIFQFNRPTRWPKPIMERRDRLAGHESESLTGGPPVVPSEPRAMVGAGADHEPGPQRPLKQSPATEGMRREGDDAHPSAGDAELVQISPQGKRGDEGAISPRVRGGYRNDALGWSTSGQEGGASCFSVGPPFLQISPPFDGAARCEHPGPLVTFDQSDDLRNRMIRQPAFDRENIRFPLVAWRHQIIQTGCRDPRDHHKQGGHQEPGGPRRPPQHAASNEVHGPFLLGRAAESDHAPSPTRST